MIENEISGIIVDSCMNIHKKLGPGLFESVYEAVLYYELTKAGFNVRKQQGIPVIWDEIKLDLGFRADLIVDSKVLIEIKSTEGLSPVHKKQVLTYLKLTDLKLGLLINFNEVLLKNGVHRIVNNLEE